MAAVFRQCFLARMQAINSLPRSSFALSTADRMVFRNCKPSNSRMRSEWSYEYFVQRFVVSHVRTIHSSTGLSRKSKNVNKEQVQLVNILSPEGAVLAEGEPLIYLERFCGYFTSHTYEEVISSTTTDSENIRTFKIVSKTDSGSEQVDPASTRKKEKGPRNVPMTSPLDMKSLKKLQAVLVEDGEVTLIIKAPKVKKDFAKSVFQMEQHVKKEMDNLCSFSFIASDQTQTSFKLQVKKKNNQFYKSLFNVVYRREKEEVDRILDYINTVNAFSDESESK